MDIDKIILKSLNDKGGLEEYEILEEWKAESVEHLNFVKMLEEKSNINYKAFDKEAAWTNINQELDQKPRINALLKYVIAACLVIGLIYSAYYAFKFNDTKSELHYAAIDSVKNYNLPDGSTIWLNKSTEVNLADNYLEQRKLQMKGEAYFEVEADKTNPFIIELDNESFIKVVGTAFNVINDSDNFDLSVYSGIVQLHTLNRVIHLEKGDRITKVNGAYAKLKVRDENKLSWKTKELVFDNIPLIQALPAIERHFNVSFELANELKANPCRLRSRYTSESITDLLKEWEQLYNLEYSKLNSSIKISALTCK